MPTIMDAFTSGFNAIQNVNNSSIKNENERIDLEKKKTLWEEYKKAKQQEEEANKIKTDGVLPSETPSTPTDVTPTPLQTSDTSTPQSGMGQGILPGESGGIPKEAEKPLYQTMLKGFLSPSSSTGPQDPNGNPLANANNNVAPTNPVASLKESGTQLSQVQTKLDSVKAIANQMRQKGLNDQADKYEAKQLDLQNDYETAQQKHLANQSTVYKIAGGLANGYLKAAAVDGADKDALWQRLQMSATQFGIPIDDLKNVPPEQREAVATDIYNKASIGDTKNRMAIEALKEDGRNERAKALLKVQQDRLDLQQKSDAWKKENATTKMDFEKDKFGITKRVEDIDTRVKESTFKLKEIDNDISKLETAKSDLTKGNLFYSPTTGLPLADDPKAVQEELKHINENIKTLTLEKEDHHNFIEDLNAEKTKIESGLAGTKVSKDLKPRIFDTQSKYKFAKDVDAASMASYTAAMDANKDEPGLSKDQLELRRKNRVQIQRKAYEAGLVEPR